MRAWADRCCRSNLKICAVLLPVIVGSQVVAEAPPVVRGVADSANVVVEGKARFTVLTPTLLRLEYAEDGAFEDRASFFAVQRDTPPQKFTHTTAEGWLVIETDRLRLRYKRESGRFGAENLSITTRSRRPSEIRKRLDWHPGVHIAGNLGGTVRTLDGCRGPVDLGQGVLSRDGWYLLDDSASILFEPSRSGRQTQRASEQEGVGGDDPTDVLSRRDELGGPHTIPWATPRPAGERVDWYFFGYGDDYAQALRDLTTVGGRIPLPPRFAFGSWYSRYWPYTAEELLKLYEEYQSYHFPLDVLVIDMDWHLDGWTGYTWNPKLIPDPDALLKNLHDRGLKVTLNLHPADGVALHEKAYPEFARAMGVDPDSRQPIPFDIADPKFARNYFDLLLHPLERQGVDFWWMDWQQSRATSIAGLDPLPWLNYLHFHDRQRAGGIGPIGPIGPMPLRGLCFSRWGGWGDHRHPIQFSGDAESTWKVLSFEVPFTATAGNVGASYWSHDLGGHWSATGRVDPELFVRWLQFGAFSPAMRVHSTRDEWNDRRPWLYGQPYTDAARLAYDLRYRLMPYIYTMARKCYDTGLPLVRPMYLMYPREERAYDVPGQFMFGDDILVAPVTEPGYGRARMAEVSVWFPPGDWYDLTTHEHYRGPRDAVVTVPLEAVAAFARGGAPIPMNPRWLRTCQQSADPLIVRLYPATAGRPGERAERELYEDDGETIGYLGDRFRRLTLAAGSTLGGEPMVTIGPARGTYSGAKAGWPDVTLELPAIVRPRTVALGDGRNQPSPGANLAWSYDPLQMVATVGLGASDARGLDQQTAVHWVVRSYEERAREARRARSLALLIERGVAQLPPQHPVAKALFDAGREIAAYYAGLVDPSAVAAQRQADSEGIVVRTRVENELRNAVARLDREGAADAAAALRTLTGISLAVSVSAGTDAASVRVQARLWQSSLPSPRSPERISVVLRPDDISRTETRQVAYDASGVAMVEFELPVDPARLTILRGTISTEPTWQNVPLHLTAPFEWNGARIDEWMVVGPMSGGRGPDAEELGPEKNLDLSAAYAGREGGQVSWTPYRVNPNETVDGFSGVVNFRRLYNFDNATAFAATTLESNSDATVDLLFRHDDGAIVWVNGKEVYRSTKPRALYDGEARVPVTLTAGDNSILVKVDQHAFNWGFVMSVAPRDGERLPELRVRPPKP
jgi:alpha-glucosidase